MRSKIGVWLVLAVVVSAGCRGHLAAQEAYAPTCRCEPNQDCWPSREHWQRLGASLKGRLEEPRSSLEPCRADATSEACTAALTKVENPFAVQEESALTQSSGWMGAWSAAVSPYAVVARAPEDIVAAVRFAREHHLRLVIKGTGHDYLGRSNAPSSLLVWTHEMRAIVMHDTFTAQGCSSTETGPTAIPAVTIEAGTRWGEAYEVVTVKNGRYVQGGGCTSVGAAGGFIQGGGFGSWSKKFGTGAAGLLEAEVVTADGRLVIANRCQNQDLFWALRGGGGGTFGVVTKATLRTHALPATFGIAQGTIQATTDAGFEALLAQFIGLFRDALSNEHWGEQVAVLPNNSLRVSMIFQGLSKEEAEAVWQPLRAWIAQHPESYQMELELAAIPAAKFWDGAFLRENVPGVTKSGDLEGHPGTLFYWAQNQEEVGAYWYTYQSRWLPLDRFSPEAAPALAKLLFAASRYWDVALHFNKGQAGAAAEALERGRETAMNPAVYDAAALIIMAANATATYPGIEGHEPDAVEGARAKERISAAMKLLRDATPGAGTYANETDYFEPDWQREFWGRNYPKLLEIKEKYDPDGLFHCHHCVGSEKWSSDGMCRAREQP